ncbi:hypothetical protein P5673_007976 [Acropora cervicornis]|uniref:Uncharacterized protein n=1 Tax=Acropora cervicornis TaxID=6130 RepID=A0AAD9QVB5_ACRCE|nr:hypothetical protein P5673_007976 [Acropora cervicornis]
MLTATGLLSPSSIPKNKAAGVQGSRYPNTPLCIRNLSLPSGKSNEIPSMLSLEDPQYHQGRQNNKFQHTSRSKNNYSINASMIKNQPRYISHVVRIADQHVPKQIFFSKQVEGMHFDRGPEEVMKANLKKCNINVPCWKATARDRTL